jgi:hypothetical protein
MRDGEMEPVARFLEAVSEREAIKDVGFILKTLADMLRGDPKGETGWKLVALPSSGKPGKPVKWTAMAAAKQRNRIAMETLDREYGFERAHRRNGVTYSPQAAIHAAAAASGLSEQYIRRNLKRLRALRDATVQKELEVLNSPFAHLFRGKKDSNSE